VQVHAAAAAKVADVAQRRGAAEPEVVAGGLLHELPVELKLATRTEARVLRVWTPPAWSADKCPRGGWPVRV